MTENEYKKLLETIFSTEPFGSKEVENIQNIFKEIQQYRAMGTVTGLQDMKSDYFDTMCDYRQYSRIGTVEEFKALKEKNDPKKPIDKIMYLECPTCGDVGILDCGYCSVCGQELDWQ